MTGEQLVAIVSIVAGVLVVALRVWDAIDRRRAEERSEERAAKRHEEQQDFIAAAAERSRIRDAKRRRTNAPRASSPVPDFVEEETTDIYALADREREERARRDSDRQETVRPRGERKARPGTHHDKG